jgi:hypothetical protein
MRSHQHPRVPTNDGSTADTTTPPTPLPGIIGSCTGHGALPARTCVSTKVMLANSTSTSAWPATTSGSGVSASTSTSGPPNSFNHTARTGFP